MMLALSAHTSAPDDEEAQPAACAWRFRPGTFAARGKQADAKSCSSLASCRLRRATSANEPYSERSEQLLSDFAPVHCDSRLRPLLQSEELGRFQAGRPAAPGLADWHHSLRRFELNSCCRLISSRSESRCAALSASARRFQCAATTPTGFLRHTNSLARDPKSQNCPETTSTHTSARTSNRRSDKEPNPTARS